MSEVFSAKIRKVGSSYGILLPKEIMQAQKVKEGESISVSIVKERNTKDLMKLFGSAKGASEFHRDHKDREF